MKTNAERYCKALMALGAADNLSSSQIQKRNFKYERSLQYWYNWYPPNKRKIHLSDASGVSIYLTACGRQRLKISPKKETRYKKMVTCKSCKKFSRRKT